MAWHVGRPIVACMPSERIGAGPRMKPQRGGLFARVAREVNGTRRLADVRALVDGDLATEDEWQAGLRMAINFGLVTVTGTGGDQVVTRTEFGEAWAARDRASNERRRWCLRGPGRFDVMFYPVTRRPEFAVFAATGPMVDTVRQGGWNLVGGFSGPEPNPVREVEMISVREDGTAVSVWSRLDDPVLSGLHLADPRDFPTIEERLTTALAIRSAPWRAWAVQVDGAEREALVLDVHGDELAGEVSGPCLTAVARLDGATVTAIAAEPIDDLVLTRINADDLVGPQD